MKISDFLKDLCEFRELDVFWISLQGQPERTLPALLENCGCQFFLRFSAGF